MLLACQYLEMKKKHPDAILLFRVGDFYETFSDDAITASEILGITLTRRANGSAKFVELAGFPHHALDTYLPKLVRAGKRVAICEQLEDPKQTKKLVKRGITELVTPGVNTNSDTLPPRSNNYLAGIHVHNPKKNVTIVGVAFLDITTGEFLCAEGSPDYINKLLNTIRPSELLHISGKKLLVQHTSLVGSGSILIMIFEIKRKDIYFVFNIVHLIFSITLLLLINTSRQIYSKMEIALLTIYNLSI